MARQQRRAMIKATAGNKMEAHEEEAKKEADEHVHGNSKDEEINANVWMKEECLLSDKEEMEGWVEAIQETRDLYSWTQQRLSSQRKRGDLETGQKNERGTSQCCCILSC